MLCGEDIRDTNETIAWFITSEKCLYFPQIFFLPEAVLSRCCWERYKFSTLVLAQGVLRKNLRLDCTDGSVVKHFIFIHLPNFSQP